MWFVFFSRSFSVGGKEKKVWEWWRRVDCRVGEGGGGQSVIWKKPWVRHAVRMEEMSSGRGRERGIRGMALELVLEGDIVVYLLLGY